MKYCHRPFSSVEEMNETMIRNHNAIVKPDDIYYNLGDFAFTKSHEEMYDILKQMNGRKILILGNHDVKEQHLRYVGKDNGWESIHNYYELKYQKINFVFFHYPIASWNRAFHGSIHLFGHTHGNYIPPINHKCMDVGVDSNDFKPISIDQVIEIMDKKGIKNEV